MAASVACRPVFADVTNLNGHDGASMFSVDMSSSIGRVPGNRKGSLSSCRSSASNGGRDFAPPRRAPLQAVPVGYSSVTAFEDTHPAIGIAERNIASSNEHNKPPVARCSQERGASHGTRGKPRDARHVPLKVLASEAEDTGLGDDLDISVNGRNRNAVPCQAAARKTRQSSKNSIVRKESPLRRQLASLFDTFRYSPGIDDRVDAVLGDLADEVLAVSHKESQRYLPNIENLLARLGNGQREPILDWLVQACDIMRLPDSIVYSTVLTLDRYCAACREPVAMESMQKVLMAVICTVLKTCAVADEVCMPLRELLLHLCRGQVRFEEILVMEHRVLQTLHFKGLFAPTALEFLEAFKMPLVHLFGDAVDAACAFDLANFLMQLSFFNAALHYGYAHSVLAASALYVALCHLQCSPVVVQNLLINAVGICSDISDVPGCVLTCGTQLHALWLDFVTVQGSRVPCLIRKFSGTRLHMTVLLSPPAALVPAPCAEESWHQWGAHTVADSPTNSFCNNCGSYFATSPYTSPEMMPMNAVCPNCEPQTYGSLLPYNH
mmetsp:Transcript_3590/g.5800  ORF Transcript_3590/g.5800 Transcript_3590/m.5800 type:complete len:552 (-) Transcript_3590:197-1852(-)